MEFWGAELKPGRSVSCKAPDDCVFHLKQVALGETQEIAENVVVSVKVGGQKLVIGNLSADKHPQMVCGLSFNEDFELSHNSKTTSVFLCGFKSAVLHMSEYPYDMFTLMLLLICSICFFFLLFDNIIFLN